MYLYLTFNFCLNGNSKREGIKKTVQYYFAFLSVSEI